MAKIANIDNEGNLLGPLRAGDPKAFEDAYRRYYPMILKLITENGGTGIDARDVFQETMIVLINKLGDPDFSLSGKLSTYLYAVARNIWFKRGRGIKGKTQHTDPEQFSQLDLSQSSNEIADKQEREALFDLIAEKMEELEPDCRRVLFLSIQQNFSHNEIAEIMDYSKSFVKVKKYRCLEYLRKMLS